MLSDCQNLNRLTEYRGRLHSAHWLASSLKLAARCPVSGCWPSWLPGVPCFEVRSQIRNFYGVISYLVFCIGFMPPTFGAERHHWVNCSSPGPPVVLTTHIKVLSRSIGCAVRLNGSRGFCTRPFPYPLYGKLENIADIIAPDRRVNGSVYRWITTNNRHIIVRYASCWPLLSWQGRVWIIPCTGNADRLTLTATTI